MGIAFTKEQQQVIDLRNRNILVSAAAGSGKTAVLVERIITRLTKDKEPLDVDRLLIVTFTEAAAAEMKERIHMAIEKALEEDPDNVHLQRQSTLIHQAKITTIHQFCLSVIRDYFHTIDLDPSFRVGDEGELKLLKQDMVEKVLEDAYREGDEAFLAFVESFASGRTDTKLEELILQMYEFSRSFPNPNSWMDFCVAQYGVDTPKELNEKPFIQEAVQEVKQYLKDMDILLLQAMEICDSDGGPTAYRDTLQLDREQILTLRECDSFEGLQKTITTLIWDKLKANRDKSVSEQKIQQVKDMRDEVKKTIKSLAEQYFFDSIEELQKDLSAAKKHMQVLVRLVKAFSEEFLLAKQSRNVIDFSDMEQYALQILTNEEDGEFYPSEVAENYQQKFAEVMIDEYQDSNLVQEAILTSVSGVHKGNYNIFMVGDVKQSIYRFRLSRPELFMEKYHTYSVDHGKKQRIDLHKNFRSRREVLESTNFIFEQIMTSAFGGISYDDKAALYVGAEYTESVGNDTEVLLVETPDRKAAERVEIEALTVANRIKELMATHHVQDKKTGMLRKVRYGDIVILSRNVKGWTDVFAKVLNEEGVPTYTGSQEGYFQTREIQTILNYLKILDNPRQDIPFAAVLTSMFANLDSEDLAELKNSTDAEHLYNRVCQYLETGTNARLQEQLQQFLDVYHAFRAKVPYLAIHVLLWQLLEETGYGDYVASLPGGIQRSANLQMLVEKAVAFEGTSYKGLFNFVRYMEQLQKYNVDYGEANIMDEEADVVTLMSIHKSKGLEFPIVFVTGLTKQFNQQDTRQSIILHSDLGAGIDMVDVNFRTKAPTILKKVIQQRVQKESIAEELRVLYVAMTRAKEKLILTGTLPDVEKQVQTYVPLCNHHRKVLPYYSLTKANKYMDWIIPALIRSQRFAKILDDLCIPLPYQNDLFRLSVPIQVKWMSETDLIETETKELIQDFVTREVLQDWDTEQIYDAAMKERLEEQFAYSYPYADSSMVKQKLSVSELKKKIYLEEESEQAFEEEEVIPLLPKFLKEQETLTGASKGTAYHRLLELLDFTKERDEAILAKEIASYQTEGYLTEDMGACIFAKDILGFFETPIAKRAQQAAEQNLLFKEQPFVLGVDAKDVYGVAGEQEILLVQGIIDVYFEENGELVVLDYKTDRVSHESELRERYHAQLDYYAKALKQLTGKQVKEKLIYSFALQRTIEV